MRTHNIMVGQGQLRGPNGTIPAPYPNTMQALRVASGKFIRVESVVTEHFQSTTVSKLINIPEAPPNSRSTECSRTPPTHCRLSWSCIVTCQMYFLYHCHNCLKMPVHIYFQQISVPPRCAIYYNSSCNRGVSSVNKSPESICCPPVPANTFESAVATLA